MYKNIWTYYIDERIAESSESCCGNAQNIATFRFT